MEFQSRPRLGMSGRALARFTHSFLAQLILLALAGALTIAGLLYVEKHDEIAPGIDSHWG